MRHRERATVWAQFLRATDPIPETPINEEMQAYFADPGSKRSVQDGSKSWLGLSDRGHGLRIRLGRPGSDR